MYRIYYAERDTTLYEKHPDQNTGIDQILELTKIASGSRLDGFIQPRTYNSRILIDFGSEITSLSASVSAGDIPMPDTHSLSSSVYINLHASDASELLQNYTINAYPVSQSWTNGNGHLNDTPYSKIGASWLHRSGDASIGSAVDWNTGSANSAADGVGATEAEGGGTYIITGIDGGIGSQHFVNEKPDIRMDVTHIVRGWIEGDRPNYGFIIKRPRVDELSGTTLGSLKYFGRESHTIFVPRLEVGWDDSSVATTAGISSNIYVPYIKNIKNEYRTSEIARFRIGVRPDYPIKTYSTASFYKTDERLPASSSYSIFDSVTNDVIIKDEKVYSNSTTKISNYNEDADPSDDISFFDLRMDSFMPERYYKIKLTCRRTTDTQTFDNFYFKVVN